MVRSFPFTLTKKSKVTTILILFSAPVPVIYCFIFFKKIYDLKKEIGEYDKECHLFCYLNISQMCLYQRIFFGGGMAEVGVEMVSFGTIIVKSQMKEYYLSSYSRISY